MQGSIAKSVLGAAPGQRLVLVTVLVGVALAACSGPSPTPASSPGDGSSQTGSASVSSSPATTDLTVVVKDGASTISTWHLTCDPAGGDHPDPQAACAALRENGARALPPVPRGRRCAQVFGGSATAVLTGTWEGKPVNSRFQLTNGCEIARWKALDGLLPPADAAGNR
jgi:hypothetical protein